MQLCPVFIDDLSGIRSWSKHTRFWIALNNVWPCRTIFLITHITRANYVERKATVTIQMHQQPPEGSKRRGNILSYAYRFYPIYFNISAHFWLSSSPSNFIFYWSANQRILMQIHKKRSWHLQLIIFDSWVKHRPVNIYVFILCALSPPQL